MKKIHDAVLDLIEFLRSDVMGRPMTIQLQIKVLTSLSPYAASKKTASYETLSGGVGKISETSLGVITSYRCQKPRQQLGFISVHPD